MRNVCLVWLAMMSIAGAALAESGLRYPFGQPFGMAIVSSHQHDPKGHFLIYGGTTGQSPDNWSIYQWNNSSELGPLQLRKGTDTWAAKTAVSAVTWRPRRDGAPSSFTFLQDGATQPCSNGEMDLGVQPNDWTSANQPALYPQATTATPPLDKLASFVVAGTYKLDALREAGGHKGCENNQAGSSVTIQAHTTTSPIQFFFYTVHLSWFCADGGQVTARYRACQAGLEKPDSFWYWKGASKTESQCDSAGNCSWGIDEPMSAYGQPYITDHVDHALRLDVLPRMTKLIAAGSFGMDPNLGHWVISNGGFGQAVWGDVHMASTFRGFVPTYTLR